MAIELPYYTVLESAGTVEIRVVKTGGELQRYVSIMLNTQDGSAVGKNWYSDKYSILHCVGSSSASTLYSIIIITCTTCIFFLVIAGGQDYSPLSSASLTFPSSSGPNDTFFFNVSITDDSLLEFEEYFMVRATSMDSAVTFVPGRDTSSVNILDDDSVTIEIDLDNYSIREGDGLLEVCLVVSGDLARDITINVNSLDTTAQGMNKIDKCRSLCTSNVVIITYLSCCCTSPRGLPSSDVCCHLSH